MNLTTTDRLDLAEALDLLVGQVRREIEIGERNDFAMPATRAQLDRLVALRERLATEDPPCP